MTTEPQPQTRKPHHTCGHPLWRWEVLQMSYRAIQRVLCCTIASRENLISFICDIQAASLNLTAKLLLDRTRQPMQGQWLLSGKPRRSIATLDERRLWAGSRPANPSSFGAQATNRHSVLMHKSGPRLGPFLIKRQGVSIYYCIDKLCSRLPLLGTSKPPIT